MPVVAANHRQQQSIVGGTLLLDGNAVKAVKRFDSNYKRSSSAMYTLRLLTVGTINYRVLP